MADLNVAIEMIGRDNASGVVSNVVKSLGGIPEAAGKAEGLLGGITSGLGKLGLAGMGIKTLADTVGGFATSLVSGNSEMEKYETQLGTLMGSADGAKQRLKELADFGARTPFELPEIAAAEKVLLGFGLTGEKVFKLTGKTGEQFREVVGDIAAGTGASFQEIALTMGKFSAGATGEAISRFQEMGVATREQLAAMGVQFSKSGELLSPLPVAMQAITTLAQQKFGGGMDKLSKTFEGQMSTLSDGINQAKIAIMQPIFNVLRDSLARVNELMSSGAFQTAIQTVSGVLADLVRSGIDLAVKGFDTFKTTVGNVVEAIGPTVQMLADRFGTFFGKLSEGASLAQTVNAAFGDLIPSGLNPILDAVDKAFAGIKTSFQTLLSTFQEGGFAGVWQQITDAMSAFAPTGERLQGALSAIGTAITAIIPQPVQDFVAGLLAMGTNASDGINPIQGLADVINTVSGAIQSATQFVKDHVAVQAILFGAMTAAGVAWGISLAVQAYTKAVQLAGVAVQAYTAVQAALNFVMSANPIGIVIIALAALAAGLIYAYKNSEEFRNIVDNAFSVVKISVQSAINTAKAALDVFSAAMNTTSSVAGAIKDGIVSAWNTVESSVSTAVGNIKSAIETAWSSIQTFIDTTIGTIKTTILSFWNAVPDDIKSDLTLIYNHVATQFGNVLNYINTHISTIKANIIGAWNAIQENIGTAMTTIASVVQTGWETISGVVGTVVEVIRALVEAKWNEIRGVVETVMTAVSTVVTTAWEAVRAVIGEKIDAAVALIRGFGKSVQELLAGMKETVFGLASSIGNSIVEGIKSGANAVWQSLVDWATQQIRDLLGAMARAVGAKSPSQMAAETVGVPIVQGITLGIVTETPMAQAAARNSATAIVQAFLSLREQFKPNDRIIPFGMLRTDIANNTPIIVADIERFNSQAKTAFTNLNNYLRGWIDDAVAHRTELLRIFNYAAYLRGEGTKVLPELNSITENFIRDTTTAAQEAGAKLQGIAKQLEIDIGAARQEAMRSAAEIVDATASQIRQIQLQAALQKEIKMQRDAFATLQRQAKEYFDRQQSELQDRLKQQEQIAKINYSASVKLSRVGQADNPEVAAAQSALDAKSEMLRIDYEANRDVQRAKTDDERAEIIARAAEAKQSFQDRLDEEAFIYAQSRTERENLQKAEIEAERRNALQGMLDQQNEEIAVRNATATLRAAIEQREQEFSAMQAAQLAAFEQSMDDAAFARQVNQIYAERDARLIALGQALAEKEKQIAESSEKERQTVLTGLEQQLKDYKTKYIDGVTAAFHHAGVDIADFLDQINNHLATTVQQATDNVLSMIDKVNKAKQTVGNPYEYIPQNPPLTVNQPTYPGTVIPAMPQFRDTNPTRQINLTVSVSTTEPVTAEQIAREINRSLNLAGL